MASNARITCNPCVFRYPRVLVNCGMNISRESERTPDVPDSLSSAHEASAVRWTLASLSVSALLPALGTSIANISLPTLVHVFEASFQAVQWVVLAYLLGIT